MLVPDNVYVPDLCRAGNYARSMLSSAHDANRPFINASLFLKKPILCVLLAVKHFTQIHLRYFRLNATHANRTLALSPFWVPYIDSTGNSIEI
jgi:hypothetical protein